MLNPLSPSSAGAWMKNEVVGLQAGKRDVLEQDRVNIRVRTIHIKVDQHIGAVDRCGMAGKPGVETIRIVRTERGVIELDMILPRIEIADGIVTDAAQSLVKHERVVAAITEEGVIAGVAG